MGSYHMGYIAGLELDLVKKEVKEEGTGSEEGEREVKEKEDMDEKKEVKKQLE